MTKPKASIKSLPLEVDIMIIEILRLDDALNLCDALHVPKQVAVQYCYIDKNDIYRTIHEVGSNPNSNKYLLKNKIFQIEADSDDKTWIALRTFDLELLKNYFEEVKPDLSEALSIAAEMGFNDAVKLLLSDSRVDPSADDNIALCNAAQEGHVEIVKLLLSDSRVNPSARDNETLRYAARNGNTEIVKLLLSDSRVDPSALNNEALRYSAGDGHTEIVKLLLSDSRVEPSARDSGALRYAAKKGHTEIVKLLLSDSRVDPSARDSGALMVAAKKGHTEIVKLLLSDSRVEPSAEKIRDFLSIASGKNVKKLLKSYLKKKQSKE
jgi:ankyrin repeat protein